MPDRAEVESQSASGTAAVWVTSSRANRTGLGIRPYGVREPAYTQSRWIFSITARNRGAAAPSSPELITYRVPLALIHPAASKGRIPRPETVRCRAETPTQARD